MVWARNSESPFSRSSADRPGELIFVVFGPGGVGKGTVVGLVAERVPCLWLSRSWTTRARRPSEPEDAYVFVDRARFADRIADGGFVEWAEFLGELYGTPDVPPPPGYDLLLEIDLQGARSIRRLRPDSILILLLAPSIATEAERLRLRGESAEMITRRLTIGEAEETEGRLIADHVVVNDDLERAVSEVAGIVLEHRRRLSGDE